MDHVANGTDLKTVSQLSLEFSQEMLSSLLGHLAKDLQKVPGPAAA